MTIVEDELEFVVICQTHLQFVRQAVFRFLPVGPMGTARRTLT